MMVYDGKTYCLMIHELRFHEGLGMVDLFTFRMAKDQLMVMVDSSGSQLIFVVYNCLSMVNSDQ